MAPVLEEIEEEMKMPGCKERTQFRNLTATHLRYHGERIHEKHARDLQIFD